MHNLGQKKNVPLEEFESKMRTEKKQAKDAYFYQVTRSRVQTKKEQAQSAKDVENEIFVSYKPIRINCC
jgi:hypothetical protein